MIDISIILVIAWVFFTVLAFLVKETFFYALSGVVSWILFVYLIIEYTSDTTQWMYPAFGFVLFFFGFFMMLIAYKDALGDDK